MIMATKFNVGDRIRKIVSDKEDYEERPVYVIQSLREDNGGNWHDGYMFYYYAIVIKEKFSNVEGYNFMKCCIDVESEEILLGVNQYGDEYTYVTKVEEGSS